MPGPKKGTKKKDAKSQVLACLAEQGPMNMYEIGKRSSLHYSSVHGSVNILSSGRYVQVERSLKSKKNSKIFEFGLTFKGFVTYLANLKLDFSGFFLPDSEVNWAEQLSKGYIDEQNKWLKRIGVETIIIEASSTKVDLLRVYNELRNALFSGLVKVMESNGARLDYPIFAHARWLAEKHTPVIWEIVMTASVICVHPPFNLDAVALIEQTEAEIRGLESKKTRLNDPVIRRAFPEDQPDNPFELNDKKLGYARQNLNNLLHLEDELWRRDFAKYFAYRSQYLVGIKNMKNEELAVFFKQAAEKGILEVEPAEKMANLFSGF
jgi:hypothetical protein